MREIKFRAWFELKKKMVSSENLAFQYEGDEDERFTFAFDKTDLDEDGNEKGTMCFVPLQYTGLKDKNGREIYEGDIVMQLSERTYDSLTGVVKFIDGSYVIETADGKNGGYLFDEYLFDELAFNVLIGNIYENPELLEDGVDHDSLIRWDEI